MTARMLLTVNEAADRLGVGRSFLYGVIQRGDLATVKLGRARRIPTSALEDFVRRLGEEQAEDSARWR